MALTPDSASEAERQDSMILTLRVRTYSKHGRWYAQCLELDLLTERPTETEALRALGDLIKVYLETAIEEGLWDQLVPRHAPVADRLRYYFSCFRYEVGSLLNRNRSVETFRVPVDMHGRSACA